MQYRFSGHETFPCRYAWLPKAFAAISRTESAIADDETAMIELGVGKNMVRSIRFWLQVSGIARSVAGGGFEPTDFGRFIFGRKKGADPFLEDIRTLWLLHWRISTQAEQPLFAWDYLLNRWPHHEFTPSLALSAFRRESKLLNKDLSDVTLGQHFDVFLHTYVPTRGRKGDVQEDNLDCPLVELQLVEKVGERAAEGSTHREVVYSFNRDEKPEITTELFLFCLNEFWEARRSSEKTTSLRDLTIGTGSPGQVFKLSESDVRSRLEGIDVASKGRFVFKESSAMQQVVRNGCFSDSLLAAIYEPEMTNA